MASRPAWLTPRAASVGSTATAVVVALLVWWLQGQGGTTATSDESSTSPTTSVSASVSPTETPSVTDALSAAPTESDAPSTPHDAMPETDPESGLPFVALADLPPEAIATVDLIDAGGPFPYDKDGSTFGNYEGLLPDHESGYYEEYTVETPGSPDRGARRIVAGDAGELYWTADHYESFERIWR